MTGKRVPPLTVFALIALALALFASSGTEAQSYRPLLGYSLANPAPGASSDVTVQIDIPAPDYNYANTAMVNFSPPDGWTADGTTLPIGAKVGVLNATADVGILYGPCNTHLNPMFNLYNASVDTSNELGPDAMNWIMRESNAYPVPYIAWDPTWPTTWRATPTS